MCRLNSSVVTLIVVLNLLALSSAATWTAHFEPSEITIHMGTADEIVLTLENLNYAELLANGGRFHVRASNEKLLHIDKQIGASEVSEQGSWSGAVYIDAIFLGTTSVYIDLVYSDGTVERSDQQLPVIVIRENRIIDSVFTGSVATLVSILYINFGAALDLGKLKGIVKRPIGPAIGFMGQFVIMPLVRYNFFFMAIYDWSLPIFRIIFQLSFGLALLLFPDNVEMQLGMFFTGASPAGGASNIWTILLGGNMDLSIAMSAISNIASFGKYFELAIFIYV